MLIVCDLIGFIGVYVGGLTTRILALKKKPVKRNVSTDSNSISS